MVVIFVKLLLLYLIELNYRVAALNIQIRLNGTYDQL